MRIKLFFRAFLVSIILIGGFLVAFFVYENFSEKGKIERSKELKEKGDRADPSKALNYYKEANALNPKDMEIVDDLFDTYQMLGSPYHANHERRAATDRAEKALENAIRKNSTDYKDYYYLARILIENKNQYEKAFPLLKKANELEPKDVLTILELWNITLKLNGQEAGDTAYKKMMDRALEALEPAINYRSTNYRDYLNYVHILKVEAQPEKVLPYLEKAYSLNSKDPDTLFYLAQSYYEAGKLEEAKKKLIKFKELYPRSSRIPTIDEMLAEIDRASALN